MAHQLPWYTLDLSLVDGFPLEDKIAYYEEHLSQFKTSAIDKLDRPYLMAFNRKNSQEEAIDRIAHMVAHLTSSEDLGLMIATAAAIRKTIENLIDHMTDEVSKYNSSSVSRKVLQSYVELQKFFESYFKNGDNFCTKKDWNESDISNFDDRIDKIAAAINRCQVQCSFNPMIFEIDYLRQGIHFPPSSLACKYACQFVSKQSDAFKAQDLKADVWYIKHQSELLLLPRLEGIPFYESLLKKNIPQCWIPKPYLLPLNTFDGVEMSLKQLVQLIVPSSIAKPIGLYVALAAVIKKSLDRLFYHLASCNDNAVLKTDEISLQLVNIGQLRVFFFDVVFVERKFTRRIWREGDDKDEHKLRVREIMSKINLCQENCHFEKTWPKLVWNNINIPRVADDQHIANITLVSSNTTNFDTSNNIETATEQPDVPIPCNNSDDRIVEEDPGISIEADNPDENDEVVLATQFPQLKQQNAKRQINLDNLV